MHTLLALQPSDEQQDANAGSLSIDTWLLPLSSILLLLLER